MWLLYIKMVRKNLKKTIHQLICRNFCTKERSKEPTTDQMASSKHYIANTINSNQEHSNELIRDRKI